MKKFLMAMVLCTCAILALVAQDAEKKESTKPIWDHGDNVSSISYQNVPILKIYDQKDAYVVLYEKQSLKIGTAVIPKSWAKETPRKLNFRNAQPKIHPYMTLISKDGEFNKVWITINPSRFNSIWGIYPNGEEVQGTDATTLSLEL